jgi:hypothetical protein
LLHEFAVLRVASVLLGLLLAVLASPAAAQTLQHADVFTVYDATGKRVGEGQWSQPETWWVEVPFRAPSGRTLVLRAWRSGFFGALHEVWFTTTNCTGPAFLRETTFMASLSIYPATAVIGARQTVYLASLDAGNGRPRRLYFKRDADGVCVATNVELWTLPARVELHLLDYFTLPLVVRGSGSVVPR